MRPRGIRNCNPGNIVREGDRWDGLSASQDEDSRFCVFDDPKYGIRALARLLLTYHRRRTAADGSPIDTVAEVIERWAPASENDTAAYAAAVREDLGLEAGDYLDLEDPETLAHFVQAIIAHENGLQPYDDDTIEAAVALALET